MQGRPRYAHRAVALADAVVAHDVEDAEADRVAVAAAAREAGQGHARKLAAERVGPGARLVGHALRDGLLRVRDVLALVARPAVPVQLLHRAQPQPHVYQRHAARACMRSRDTEHILRVCKRQKEGRLPQHHTEQACYKFYLPLQHLSKSCMVQIRDLSMCRHLLYICTSPLPKELMYRTCKVLCHIIADRDATGCKHS